MTKLSELELPAVPYRGHLLQTKAIVTPFAHTRITLRNNVLQLALSSIEANRETVTSQVSDHICSWL
ncbi:MAG: hypothetical protein ACD_39C01162G0004, partial [uncultured bacterium]